MIDLTVSDDPKVYTAIFTPTDELNEGAAGNSGAAIRVLAVTYKDSAGNTGAVDSDLSTPTSIDTLAPNVTNTNAAYISASNSLAQQQRKLYDRFERQTGLDAPVMDHHT